MELIWAYTSVRYLYQQIKLNPLKTDELRFPWFGFGFETSQHICSLSKSEGFFLVSELLKGKIVTQKFKNKYRIEYWNDEDKKEFILTDGRFYKFKGKIVDLGYNFLVKNNLTEKFRMKNEYER